MVDITFILPSGDVQTIEAPAHWSILQIAQHHNIPNMEGVCGGCVACATCHIYIHPDWKSRVENAGNEKTEEEEDALEMAFNVTEDSRLGCQIELTEDLNGLVVTLPLSKA